MLCIYLSFLKFSLAPIILSFDHRDGLRREGEREEEEKMGVKTKAKEEKNSCD